MNYMRHLGYGIFRSLAFWGLTLGVFWFVGKGVPLLDWHGGVKTLPHAIKELFQGNVAFVAEQFGHPEFSAALAKAIGSFAIGLLVAYGVMHAVLVRFTLWRARRILADYNNRRDFAIAYEAKVHDRLITHSLIGHAWKEFDETLVKPSASGEDIIRNTVRPQSFVNYAVVRDHLVGLKFIGSIGGYFVGLGLLLTFIGIVLALQKAAPAVQTGSADEMKSAMADLLKIASFKFSTSIAGLSASLLFAICARYFVSLIENGLALFCEAAEHQMLYTPPQSITFEMRDVAKEQRDQLKEINSDRYFTRIAEHMSPLIQQAMSAAVTPVIGEIGKAVSDSMQGSAGTEIARLGETLAQVQSTLDSTRLSLQGSGEDFSHRMAEASERLERVFEFADTLTAASKEIRAVAAPLSETGAMMTKASGQMQAAIDASAERFTATTKAAGDLADALREQIERLGTLWEGYKSQFDKVDQDLANAVQSLAGATETQSERLTRFAKEIDAELSKVLDRLQPMLSEMRENTEELADNVEKLNSTLGRVAAE